MFNIIENLNLNFSLILMIVGIVEYIKNLKINEKLQKWLKRVIPFILSFVVGIFVTKPFNVEIFFMNSLIYFGISTLFYKAVIRSIDKYVNKTKADE